MVCQGLNLSEHIDCKYINEQQLLEHYYKSDKVSKSFYDYFKNLFWCLTVDNSIDRDLATATIEIENSYKRTRELMNLVQYRELLFHYNSKTYNKTSLNPDLKKKLAFIADQKYPPAVKNFLLYQTMKTYIEENPDVGKISKEAIAFFKTNCKDQKYVGPVEKQLQPSIVPMFMDQIVKKNKGRIILIDIWASWCAPCRGEFPAERKLMENHPEMAFLFFSVDSKKEDWQRAMAEYPNMLNEENSFLLTRQNLGGDR